MERREFRFEVKELNEDGTFEGYASVFGNVDLVGDVVEKGAFKQTIRHSGGRVPILWQHDPKQPIGVTERLEEDDRGLRVKGRLALATQRGREAYELLKMGAMRGLSIGYDVVKQKIENGVRKLKELRLWEVSIVTFPANPEAGVVAVKASDAITPLYPPGTRVRLLVTPHIEGQPMEAVVREAVVGVAYGLLFDGDTKVHRWYVESELAPADEDDMEEAHKAVVPGTKGVVPFQNLPLADRDRPWDADAAVARVRSWAGGPEKENMNWARYRRAFLWYDASEPENFGSYKLPIADVIDGELKAVPRAIFAAAAVLQGARGGVDVPESDIPRLRAHIARYYAKMRREFDDDSLVPPWEKDEKGAGHEPALSVLRWLEGKAGRRHSERDIQLIKQIISAAWDLLDDPDRDEVWKALFARVEAPKGTRLAAGGADGSIDAHEVQSLLREMKAMLRRVG